MAALILLVLFVVLSGGPSISGASALQQQQQAYITASISQKGLDYAKDLLVARAVRSLAFLRIPDISTSVRIPLVGLVQMSASNITLDGIAFPSSTTAAVGDSGILIDAAGTSLNLSLAWEYSYSSWLVKVSDSGAASIQVEGMEVGLTMGLRTHGGTLKLSVANCGCYMRDLDISLNGGASWFYQSFVDGFSNHIRSAVENAITAKITEGASELDSLLQNLPKEIIVDDAIALNVTIVNDPVFRTSSVEFGINGLFYPAHKAKFPVPKYFDHVHLRKIASRVGGSSKMLHISLDESVFNSAAIVYFQAGLMNWIVDEVPDQFFLNTAGWKFLLPQLYTKYPDDDMLLNISVTSVPSLDITIGKIRGHVDLDITVNVLDANNGTVPVGCISLAVAVAGAVELSGNNIAGAAELDAFSITLKWSDVGDFHTSLIQGVVRLFLNKVFIPYVNSRLRHGFPLPIIDGFAVSDAYTLISRERVIVSADVVYHDSSGSSESIARV